MTPFRSTSRLRTSSALKQLRSLELLQQLMTRNGFFNNCSSNGNAFAVTTLTSALIGSFTTNNQQPLKLSRLGFDKPSTYLLQGFATLHRASSQRPLGHPARPLSPPQHLQLPRAIPPALVFDTAGDRRPPILATYVDLASRQHAHSLARRSDNGVNHRCFRQHWLRQHSRGAFRGTPRVWRLLDALGTTTNHSSEGAQSGPIWATREPTTHTRQAHSLISRQHQRCGLLDKIQLSQQALNGRALPHRTLATKAPNLARSALHPIRTQHCRPSVSSSQCRPLEPQATHAKFLAATSPTTFGAISRYRPICMPPISSRSSLLYSATRSSLSRVQWPPPELVATTRRLSEPAMESPPSSFAQDASFSIQRSSSIPRLAAAVMVRRSRSLQQGYLPSPVAVHMCTPASPGQSRAVSTPRAGVKGHALRLCLTNNIWTACRLLSVKGDLATAVCEGHTRQIAFDTLAKYNVIKIGTTGPGQVPQYLTLPILRQSRQVSRLLWSGARRSRHTSFVKHASFTNHHLSLHWLPRVLGKDSIFKFATLPLCY